MEPHTFPQIQAHSYGTLYFSYGSKRINRPSRNKTAKQIDIFNNQKLQTYSSGIVRRQNVLHKIKYSAKLTVRVRGISRLSASGSKQFCLWLLYYYYFFWKPHS